MMPWNRIELRGWCIVGMNHYHMMGNRNLFVAMADKNGHCIQAEGSDEVEVFRSLAIQAFKVTAPRSE